MGYYPEQLRDLEATIKAVPADVVVSATPFDIGGLLHLQGPLVRVGYELEELEEPRLSTAVRAFLRARGLTGSGR